MGINDRVEFEDLLIARGVDWYERKTCLRYLRLAKTEAECDALAEDIFYSYHPRYQRFQRNVVLEEDLILKYPDVKREWERIVTARDDPETSILTKRYCTDWLNWYEESTIEAPVSVLFGNCWYYDYKGFYDFDSESWTAVRAFENCDQLRGYIQCCADSVSVSYESEIADGEVEKTASSIMQDIAIRELKALETSLDHPYREANMRHFEQILRHARKIE